ncbi:hypothetical protein COV61_04970, partial [Candidatus Micrarchaeota archaeon CG11_big_fil_rev_8_21_14_0_20_47_5]
MNAPAHIAEIFQKPGEELLIKAILENPEAYLSRSADYYYFYWCFALTFHYDEEKQMFVRADEANKSIMEQYKDVLLQEDSKLKVSNTLLFMEYMMRGLQTSACAELARAQGRMGEGKAAEFGSTYKDVHRTTGNYYDVSGKELGTFASEEEAANKAGAWVKVTDAWSQEERLVYNRYRGDKLTDTKIMADKVMAKYNEYKDISLEQAIDKVANGDEVKKAAIIKGLENTGGIPSAILLAHLAAGVTITGTGSTRFGTDAQHVKVVGDIKEEFGDKAEGVLNVLQPILYGGYDNRKFIDGKKAELGLNDAEITKLKELTNPLRQISSRVAPERGAVEKKALETLAMEIEAQGKVLIGSDYSASLKASLAADAGAPIGEEKKSSTEAKYSLYFSAAKDGVYNLIEGKENIPAQLSSDGTAQVPIPTENEGFVKIAATASNRTLYPNAQTVQQEAIIEVVNVYEVQIPRHDNVKTTSDVKQFGVDAKHDVKGEIDFTGSSMFAYRTDANDRFSFVPEGTKMHYYVLSQEK